MPQTPTACLALADGTIFMGRGFGAPGLAVAELCFNTAMTGYQEVMTDPSYAQQVIAFTFPHIGNVGANAEDEDTRGISWLRVRRCGQGHGGRSDVRVSSDVAKPQRLETGSARVNGRMQELLPFSGGFVCVGTDHPQI